MASFSLLTSFKGSQRVVHATVACVLNISSHTGKFSTSMTTRVKNIQESESSRLQTAMSGRRYVTKRMSLVASYSHNVHVQDFEQLASDPQNAHILTTIHSSAFVLCLDTESANNIVEHSRHLWHGAVVPPPQPGIPNAQPQLGLRNRWMDKPCQFIVLPDGKAGFAGEHSVMDGTPTATMCDRVLDIIASKDFATSSNSPLYSTSQGALPEPLDWNVSPEIQRAMDVATEAATALITSQTLNVVRTPYGKAAVKTFGVSPDGWTQMIIQLAYARLLRAKGWKRQGGTYEAASTRKFLKGRTEAIRVVSAESDAWVASMDDASADADKRVTLLRNALKRHGADARAAGNARGIDRHLLGGFSISRLRDE